MTEDDRVNKMLFGMGFAAIMLFWKALLWAVVVGAALLVVLWVAKVVRTALWEAEQRKLAICRRADEQHALVMQGDPRGTYGDAARLR